MTTADDVWVIAALAGLTGMGPRRLRVVLRDRSPAEAWRAITAGRLRVADEERSVFAGRLPALQQTWSAEARARTPDRVAAACRSLGVDVVCHGWPGYPRRLIDDPEPPAVLFVRGDPQGVDRPSVAIVGTRRATAYGSSVASDLGRDLASEGVAVVSGLAVGIDAAAHRGALEVEAGPGPVGVVGSGLDVVYPRRNTGLWREIGRRGVLFSEAPPGTPPEPWRFPSRNRIIAGLAEVIVVVESPEAGGSMITVDEAVARQRPVLAVPGSVYSPASAGPNKLLFDGCSPVRGVDDVLGLLGQHRRTRRAAGAVPDVPRSPEERLVLDAIGWEPALTDEVALRSGLALDVVIRVVDTLVHRGQLVRDSGFLRQVSPQTIEVRRR